MKKHGAGTSPLVVALIELMMIYSKTNLHIQLGIKD
jgi:hypothetical protein